jgi:aspartate/methionine/tyrosine aminotransferase
MARASLREGLATESSDGNLQLRESIMRFMKPIMGLTDKDGVLVSHGATTTLNSVMKALIDPGDEVIILDPSFGILYI